MSSHKKLSISETLNQFDIDEVILWLNAQNIGDWFVCYACGDLTRGSPFELLTSEHGDQQTFCTSCILYCINCECNYAPSMTYFHDNC